MARRLKYKNKISVVGGVRYLSQLERDRHQQLLMLEKAGAISDLKWQVPYRLEVNGVLVCRYIVDATYIHAGDLVAEEVKGRWTDVAKLKVKLFRALFPHIPLTVTTRKEVYVGRKGKSGVSVRSRKTSNRVSKRLRRSSGTP